MTEVNCSRGALRHCSYSKVCVVRSPSILNGDENAIVSFATFTKIVVLEVKHRFGKPEGLSGRDGNVGGYGIPVTIRNIVD